MTVPPTEAPRTHHLPDRVLFIHDGKIVFDGKPGELAHQNGNLEQAFYKLTAQPV